MHDATQRWKWWIGGFALWTALALLSASERGIWLLYRGQHVNWARIATYSLADWHACGVFIPLLVFATRRWPIDRRHLASRIPLHLAIILGVSVAKIALFQQVRPFLPGANDMALAEMLASGTIGEMIAFGSVAGVLHAAEFHHRFREREALSLQLQARLSDAQLRALRAQLNPHFLFNTLNAATALLHRDPDAADAMLTRLGELLRLTLRADPDHETPLREEIEFLDRYVAIMRIRFADRVTIRSDVDAGVREALVPSFILQPIVENAFEHGVGRLQRPGSIDISAHASGGALVLQVRDDGPGPVEASRGLGVGLTNTRQRLAELYGAAAGLTLSARAGGGTVVEVRLPLRLEDQAA
ncbi:MAG: histidine kinase [Cytophagaceae bacterium]|nr:histidine kinase [Gemmatimonadaceae bacterium]